MGEKYLNAIDKPVPGLITHADSGLHIDQAPRFLQTPLWAASGLPPANLAQAECMEGDLRRAGGGMRCVARGTSRKNRSKIICRVRISNPAVAKGTNTQRTSHE